MRKRILIINENVDETEKNKERLVSAYNDVECVTSIHDAVNRFVSIAELSLRMKLGRSC